MIDMAATATNILTFDIEDWCQSSPEVFYATRESHASAPTKQVVANTRRLLRILDEFKIRSTCFVLGSVAEAFPDLVREIRDSGHEVASHGYHHFPVYLLKPEKFMEDVERSLECLERITGEKIRGYRAPYFSITRSTDWALPILADLGLEYDASRFPLHCRYYPIPGWDGAQDVERFPGTIEFKNKSLMELPPTTVRILGQNLPFSGGAFLRLLPLCLFRWAIRNTNCLGYPGIFYLHPHDLDYQALSQSMTDATLKKQVLQWMLNAGRNRNERKLKKLLAEFPFTSIREWMKSNWNYTSSQ